MEKIKKFIPVIVFVVLIAAIGLITIIVSNKNSSATATKTNGNETAEQTSQPKQNSEPIENIDQKWSKGKEGAKIQVVEYSDFQCPYCKKGSETIEKVFQKYKDDMKLTFVHHPLSEIHPFALNAAKAAEAAGYQGKFWEMQELLFANQKNLTKDDFLTYAKKLGLDMDKFEKYYENKNIEEKILKQLQEADQQEYDELGLDDKGRVIVKGKSKIEGTPAFVINGKLIAGAYPEEAFDKFIQVILAEKK